MPTNRAAMIVYSKGFPKQNWSAQRAWGALAPTRSPRIGTPSVVTEVVGETSSAIARRDIALASVGAGDRVDHTKRSLRILDGLQLDATAVDRHRECPAGKSLSGQFGPVKSPDHPADSRD